MRIKLNYFIIPLLVVGVSVVGSIFTSQSVNGWYQTINTPGWTPAGSIIGAVWTVLFILIAVSALIFWNRVRHDRAFRLIVGVFLLNAVLNIFWSYLFFGQHLILLAFVEIIILEVSILALIFMIWPLSRSASVLLWPYAGWVAFAGYLNYAIWQLNSLA